MPEPREVLLHDEANELWVSFTDRAIHLTYHGDADPDWELRLELGEAVRLRDAIDAALVAGS